MRVRNNEKMRARGGIEETKTGQKEEWTDKEIWRST